VQVAVVATKSFRGSVLFGGDQVSYPAAVLGRCPGRIGAPGRCESDDEAVTVRFAGTLSAESGHVLGALAVVLPGQSRFVLDLSGVRQVLPGALEALARAVRLAVMSAHWRVSLAAGPLSAWIAPSGCAGGGAR
jgi:hypothetical protein